MLCMLQSVSRNSYTLPACHVTFGHVPLVDHTCLNALHHVLLQSWSVASGLLVACLSLSYPQLVDADILRSDSACLVLQTVLQRLQQCLTLTVLEEGQVNHFMHHAVELMSFFYRANQRAHHVPLAAFYNDAGTSPITSHR